MGEGEGEGHCPLSQGHTSCALRSGAHARQMLWATENDRGAGETVVDCGGQRRGSSGTVDGQLWGEARC